MTIRLYAWDDANAPQMSGANDGSLLNVLRGCLVDGYGTRTPVGWTMPYSDLGNNIGCFRPANGDLVHFRLDDNRDYRWSTVSAFNDMTDENTGDNEFPSPLAFGYPANYESTVSKVNSSSAEDLRWWVIADESFFYYMAHDTNYPAGFFYGKMDYVDPSHPNPYVLSFDWNTAGQIASSADDSLFDYSTANWGITNGHLNLNSFERVKVDRYTASFNNPNPITGKLLLQKLDVSTYDSPRTYFGSLPSMYRGVGTLGPSFIKVGEIITLGGKTYHSLSYSSNSWFFEFDVSSG